MKHQWIVMAFVVLAAMGTGAASAEAARVDRREARQHARIVHGVRSGALTRVKAARLRTGQRHIHRAERRVERDGVVTLRERGRLERIQDRQSRVIRRLKHNGRRG